MADTEKEKRLFFDSKRCPGCSIDLPLDCVKCPGCGAKVGKVDRFGRAKEPIDWVAYTLCVATWLLFGFFLWWGFFRD